ncbi:MAG: Formamidopyrimidine-DNA glycosylase [Acidimicrobiales bacterium AG-410-I20]|nr:MAG: Formamidopyrimidine-DNA glycosylase [Acidimicrobiales bacterium AG-410-I20]
MPEILEIEAYRRLAEKVVGRVVSEVQAPDHWYVKGGATPEDLVENLTNRRFTKSRRKGKLLLLDSGGPTLGLRFGMTGRLFVDGKAGIDQLEWGSRRINPAWHRFIIEFKGGGSLVIDDPRRLGGVELNPQEERLGPDAWEIRLPGLRKVLSNSTTALKARLLDQSRIAGLGNLLVDEICWRSSLDPNRPANSLEEKEIKILNRTIRTVLDQLDKRGGSHTGDFFEHRNKGGVCPLDAQPLRRSEAGGRTTWWCPLHQR